VHFAALDHREQIIGHRLQILGVAGVGRQSGARHVQRPLAASIPRFTPSTAPDALPKLTTNPSGAALSSDVSHVSFADTVVHHRDFLAVGQFQHALCDVSLL
jgi:sulfur carrier protein ThiS